MIEPPDQRTIWQRTVERLLAIFSIAMLALIVGGWARWITG